MLLISIFILKTLNKLYDAKHSVTLSRDRSGSDDSHLIF